MSGGSFDYIENNIKDLVNDYNDWNSSPKERNQEQVNSENIKEIPDWFIELLTKVYDITHDIDWDLSGDTGVEDGYFEKKKKELNKLLQYNKQ